MFRRTNSLGHLLGDSSLVELDRRPQCQILRYQLRSGFGAMTVQYEWVIINSSGASTHRPSTFSKPCNSNSCSSQPCGIPESGVRHSSSANSCACRRRAANCSGGCRCRGVRKASLIEKINSHNPTVLFLLCPSSCLPLVWWLFVL